ncbi:putative movement protein [Water chestnut soymovirus 1]|uniref:Putative movement protein n=1 Tax=Water chestnut soymovirus 1 TaxID=1848040 RepID=A0A172PC89_9VIRU|nr:putative movement protein [Water chestnut soymovirus 1]AND65755.1 putative movement protein [Water chestnut soymovirus 1]
MDNNDHNVIEYQEESGNYFTDILLDRDLVTKVKNHGDLDLVELEGIKSNLFGKLNRENVIYYGIMQGEQGVNIEQADFQYQVPLVVNNQINKRLSKIKESDRSKIGLIHINTVQIILKSTYREGIKTPVTIKVKDNRIVNDSESLLGEIKGDLGFGIVKFNVSLQYPIPLRTKRLNNAIGVQVHFEHKKLMKEGDIPLIVCFRISYALSNSCLSIKYKNQDRIYTSKLFNETSTILLPDKINKNFLLGEGSNSGNLSQPHSIIRTIEESKKQKESIDEIKQLTLQIKDLQHTINEKI